MPSVWEMVGEVGPLGWIIVAAGAIGTLAAVLALILAAGRHLWAARIATAGAILGMAAALAGGGDAAYLRRVTEAAIADTEARPIDAEMIRREGYTEARRPARVGLGAAAVPIGLGVAALIAARLRRRARGIALGAPVAMACAGVLCAGFAAAAARAPIPGRAIPLDAPDWAAMDRADKILQAEEGADIADACRELEEKLGDAVAETDATVVKAGRRCVEDRVARAVLLAPLSRVYAALADIRATPFALRDRDLGTEVQKDLDEVLRMMAEPTETRRLYAPRIRAGDAVVNGPLPAEVVRRIVRQSFGRFRLCYDDALARRPELAGTVSVSFVIGRDGAPRVVSTARSSDFPDVEMVGCVRQAFDGLSFPQPEGREVTVTYPLLFSPS